MRRRFLRSSKGGRRGAMQGGSGVGRTGERSVIFRVSFSSADFGARCSHANRIDMQMTTTHGDDEQQEILRGRVARLSNPRVEGSGKKCGRFYVPICNRRNRTIYSAASVPGLKAIAGFLAI
ncbi:hypothetical protein GWI33_012624 [Rhynchophorus ferrugineus]|uniref:Uncharacterized protein n=1 Tax=Rhynchophorus ferrugineus TaxID=354439 RepID=A0A834IB15_RHYFE|nr:hypothetical protein GWI33_012624 [Rhynchophorus ferrugineus]